MLQILPPPHSTLGTAHSVDNFFVPYNPGSESVGGPSFKKKYGSRI